MGVKDKGKKKDEEEKERTGEKRRRGRTTRGRKKRGEGREVEPMLRNNRPIVSLVLSRNIITHYIVRSTSQNKKDV